MENYTYPRVTISTKALKHSNVQPDAEDTTVLFVPFESEKGPSNEVVKIHSLEEFIDKFGNLMTDDAHIRTSFNIANWLTAGGTIYGYRMVAGKAAIGAIVKYSDSNVVATTGEAAKLTGLVLVVPTEYNGNNFSEKVKLYVDGVETSFTNYPEDGQIVADTYYYSKKDKTVKLYKGAELKRIFKLDPAWSISENDSPVSAKYEGAFYNKLTLEVSKAGSSSVNLVVKNGRNTLESILMVKKDRINEVSSEYFKDLKIDESNLNLVLEGNTLKFSFSGGENLKDFDESLLKFWKLNEEGNCPAKSAIASQLEFPIDLIMDASYNTEIKTAMTTFIAGNSDIGVDAIRDDIRGYFDVYVAGNVENHLPEVDWCTHSSNLYIYTQHMTVEDTLSDSAKDIIVGPSYFLSQLVPANDILYGIQFPTAGKRRAVLAGIKEINENPDSAKKEALFASRINYIEKDSRGYYFMSQRTYDGSSEENFTALSFINNSRVVCRMVHELEALGREYLFEFNDAQTLSNMSAVLNRYVTNWISNRTLSYGNVVVSKNTYSDEAVDVKLNIKFTGTIEVISIDITIE